MEYKKHGKIHQLAVQNMLLKFTVSTMTLIEIFYEQNSFTKLSALVQRYIAKNAQKYQLLHTRVNFKSHLHIKH